MGEGKKCESCAGNGYVNDSQARKMWGQAFPGHLEGKKFVLDFGGEVPHIPNIKHSSKHEALRNRTPQPQPESSVPATEIPKDDGTGVVTDDSGNVFIFAPVAEMKAGI